MKKIYILPSIKVIKIQTSQIVMTSIPVDSSKGTTTQLGRKNSLWDEEEDWDDEEEY